MSFTAKSLSVVIVTKNREKDLLKCISSLLSNSQLPDELIVIDNCSTDSTAQIVNNLSKTSIFPISHCLSSGYGYPTIYNQGLIEAKNEWVAFIDDDCIASINWIKSIRSGISKWLNSSVIIGKTETLDLSNVFSQATLLLDQNWKNRGRRGSVVRNYEILDNKNIVYNKKWLLDHGVSYDNSRSGFYLGAAEDCDLGIQIQDFGGRAYYNSSMVVWHKDPRSFFWYVRKTIQSWRSYNSLSDKWNISCRKKMYTPSKAPSKVVLGFGKKYSLNNYQIIKLYFVVKMTLLINRILNMLKSIRFI